MPPKPAALFYIYGWFSQLGRYREFSDGIILPLSWTQIEAWARMYRVQLERWELDVLTELDDLWLEIMRDKQAAFDDEDD